MELIPGDIILVRGTDEHRSARHWARWLVSWLIAKLTDSPYTHAAMYIGGGRIVECDVGQPVSVHQLSKYRHYDVFRVAGATDRERAEAVSFCLSKIGAGYDYTAVVTIGLERLLRRPITWARGDPARWYCSELVAAAWRLDGEQEGRVTPGDLAAMTEKKGVERLLKTLSMGNLLTADKGFVAAAGAAVGAFVDVMYGPDRFYIAVIFWLMIAFDWLTGIRAAKKDKTYTSAYGIDGVFRTAVMVALPVLGNLIDLAFGSPGVIFYGFTVGLAYHTWQSFTANAVRAGWERWIPKGVLSLVDSELKAKMARSALRQQAVETTDEKGGAGQ